jgi:hypothetical protein
VPLNVAAELDGFASVLVHHPRLAERQGLGTLAEMMARDKGYAAHHGWGATLDLVLSQHPGYAARHHLTALIASPAASQPTTAPQAGTTAALAPSATASAAPSSAFATTIMDATTASGSATTQTLASSPPAQLVVTVAPQSFAVDVGGVLDVAIQP